MSGTVVCIPASDESDDLGPLVEGIRSAAPDVDVLLIDVADVDGGLADSIAARDPRVRVLHRPGERGLGRSRLAGFADALEHGYDVVVELSADGTHRAADLPALLAGVAEADVVLGSRWIHGGSVSGWPLPRRLLSRGVDLAASLLLMLPVQDATGGFRAYRAATLRQLGLDTVRSDDPCSQVELVQRAVELGARVREVPIAFLGRRARRSRTTGRIAAGALLRIVMLALVGPAVDAPATGRLEAAHQR